MVVNGIIAEYNPFHNGHALQIRQGKEETGADYTIVVMSGNFVQRGAPAMLDKYSRTRMALEGGALFNAIALAQGYRLDTYLILLTDWSLMGNMLFLAVFCAFASYVCYNKLLNYVEPALGNNIVSSLSTVIGVVCGIIVMGDLWGWYTILGMAVTLAGVWLASMRMREDL